MNENETTPVQPTPPVAPATDAIPPRDVRRSRGRLLTAGGALGALGIATGVVIGVQTGGPSGTVAQRPAASSEPVVFGRGGFGGGYGSGGYGYGVPGQSDGSSTSSTATATTDQQVGIVDIDTVLGYQSAQAAGTGMVLTSNGEVLTNNHVVQGATKIQVTVVSTGATYTATVVGTDPGDDVAVLQLSGASGLTTADIGTNAAQVGDAVTAVGNAGGSGGTPSAASGTVTALDRSITATDENGSNAEQLTGLIETNADVQAGDSGGPLYDTASGRIVGMDTAAASGGVPQGYAIPIGTALGIADQIESGADNGTVHQGYPAFLGVSVQDATGGATVAGVVSGGPAEQAGLVAGDTVTAVGGTTIGSADDLTTALAGHQPGDSVRVTWTDTAGTSHTATVTLASGPAD